MRQIKPSPGAHAWPRHAVPSVECRKRDLVVRIADWHRCTAQSGGWDVEVYIGGVYDWNESKNCATKEEATAYAAAQIAKLL